MESFMDDALRRAFRDAKLTGNGFIRDVFDVFMGHGMTVLFAAAFFGKQTLNRFWKEVGTMEAFRSFFFDDQNSSDPFVVDEGGFSGVMVVEV